MYGDLFQANHGDLDKTLAAYNWGQGNLNNDINGHTDKKGVRHEAHGADWERFAPKETRDYIQKIEKTMKENGGGSDGGGVTVIIEQSNTTNVGSSTKTKKLSTTINPPSAYGMTHRVTVPSNNTNV